MQMTDLLAKKRDGGALSTEEIQFMIRGYTAGTIPDYQMSAMCMAILLRGMDDREVLDLTTAMMHSGEVLDLSPIQGVKVDKHSTGGVGDKTSLVLCPMVAAAGLKVAKMSGRGLGHTGGTIDKLESFPGFSTAISEQTFFDNVNRIGIAIMGQTADLVPADKKLYALRDVTATVSSIPLIVSSIMSKKLASGADVIVLDVKCGDGAFMKTPAQAEELARGLTRIGCLAGRKCAAVITDMDQPLGWAVGNALEVKEALAVLRGEQQGELLELCLELGGCMLQEAGAAADREQARGMLLETIRSGAALNKLAQMVEAQGGDPTAVYEPERLPTAPVTLEALAEQDGFVSRIHAERVGLVSMHLGGGRATKEDSIDLSVASCCTRRSAIRCAPGRASARSTPPISCAPSRRPGCCAAALRSAPCLSNAPPSSRGSFAELQARKIKRRKDAMKRIYAFVLAAALLLCLCACGSKPEPQVELVPSPTPVSNPEVFPLPAEGVEGTPGTDGAFEPDIRFSTTDRDGTACDESLFAGHSLTMINFWEPWCGPCVGEMPDLERLYQAYKDKGFQIVGIYETEDMEDEVDSVLRDTGVSYPILHYADVFDRFSSGYVPNTLFVDGEGHILRHEPDPDIVSMLKSNGTGNAEELAAVLYIGSNSYAGWESIIREYLDY